MSKRDYGKPSNFGKSIFGSSVSYSLIDESTIFTDLQYDIARKLKRTEMIGDLLRLGSMEILAVVVSKCAICENILYIGDDEIHTLPSKRDEGQWVHVDTDGICLTCDAGAILDKYYEAQESLNT